MMKRKLILLALCAIAAFPAEAKRPNVVLVVTDDQGYGDLSCHGNPVLKTPNLDALHSESVRLTDYHVAPTCSPTRAALITGHWTNRTGVWHTIMGRSLIRDNEVTVGTMLKDSGYRTAMFGKWHLGDNYPYRPEDRGFEEVLRHGGGGVGQTPDYWDNAYFDGSYWRNGVPEPAEGFCSDVFFNAAIDFIDDVKDGEEPFFVYLCTNAPHGPMHAPEYYSAPYAEHGVGLSNFYGMIANIDDNVGRMRSYLKTAGLEEDTIFIFTTDNGTAAGAGVFNDNMRGQKGSEYDGGHRVPFFIRYPNGGLVGGRDVEMITSYVDVTPTLLDYCEAEKPDSVEFDGVSIRPLLEETATDWPDRILVTDSQRVRDPIKWRKSAVMTDQWRLINGEELYDINVDPSQRTNIATGYPEVVERLRGFYESWWREIEPTFGEPTAIYIGHPNAERVRLTSHDWITQGGAPWNQRHIRNAYHNQNAYGFWALDVKRSGRYIVELRRWPKEADAAITAELPAGADVPGATAMRATVGESIPAVAASIEVSGAEHTKPVSENAKGVSFEVELKEGRDQLWSKFHKANGDWVGAYYAYVTWLGK